MKIIRDREKAVRLARTIVHDIRFCNQDRVRESREQGNVLEAMAEEIARGLERLTSRVSEELDPEGIYHQAVEDLLVRPPEEAPRRAAPEDKVHCCPRCRLIQPPADECAFCCEGTPMAVRSFRWGSTVGNQERRRHARSFLPYLLFFGFAALIIPTGVVWLLPKLWWLPALLLPFLVLGVLALIVRLLIREPPVTGTNLPSFLPAGVSPGSKVVRGVAWRLSGTTSTYLDDEECLAAALLFYEETPENLHYWTTRQVGLLVECEDEQGEDQQVLVRDAFWLDPQGARITGEVPGAEAKRVLKSLGIIHPGLFKVPGHELALRDGDTVEARGVIRKMVLPELADRFGLRGSGQTSVLVGGPEAPLVVRVVEPGAGRESATSGIGGSDERGRYPPSQV